MTDNEIIKALEICSGTKYSCSECYLLNYSTDYNACMAKLMTDAKDLITRQKCEIVKQKCIKQLLRKDIKTAKSEAVKEFAMKLKCGVPQETGVIRCTDIDNLVKEMGEYNSDE